MSKKDRIAAFKAGRDKRRKESTEKVLSSNNVKALSPAKTEKKPEKEETPKTEPKKEETMHEKMYRIATSKYNPFSVGGSEEWHDSKPG